MPTIVHDFRQIDFELPGKRHYQVAFHLDGSWGYSLVPLTVVRGHRKAGSDAAGVAIFGGTHGNEWEGQIAVKRLCRNLEAEALSGLVLLVPQLSESACAANRRTSPLDNVNMNRAFPGDPKGTISARIAHFVKAVIFPRVGVVADLHSGGVEGGFALCTSLHPVPDLKQRAEMLAAAQAFDTPFIFFYSSDMASGLLTDEAEAEGKIAVGGEFGYGETVNRAGVTHAYDGVLNLLRRYGLLDGEIQKVDSDRPSPPRIISAPNLEDYVPCPASGIWEPRVDLGQDVSTGEIIGFLHDFGDHSSEPIEIRAHRAGVLIMMHAPAKCAKGVTLYVIAQDYQVD
ncbi:MAG TPA: succinylglutamate desuccinylase/aspartoacylase family protein [Bryobacteraceae bacterium]|jgi:predicted deacylase